MTIDDSAAHRRRGWDEASRLKRRHWAERHRALGSGPALSVAEALRAHMQAVRPGWPSPEDRRADLEHHVELKGRIDRAAEALASR